MKMKENIIVTEGKFDRALLEKVLPPKIRENAQIVDGRGDMSALSLARSYCLKGDYQVLLVIDSDTLDEGKIREKRNFAEHYFKMVTSPSKFKVVMLVPELEALFFADKKFIEDYFKRSISDLEFDLFKRDPGYALKSLSGGEPFASLRDNLLGKIDDNMIQKINREPAVREIVDYFA